MSALREFLDIKREQLNRIRDEVNERLREEGQNPTDEFLQSTVDSAWHSDRYILVMPDGSRWGDVPGHRLVQTGFQQRPAALKQGNRLPGCRVFDKKEGMFINE